MSACDIRQEMVGWALDHKDELSETVRIALNQINISVNYWINNMQQENSATDEIALY